MLRTRFDRLLATAQHYALVREEQIGDFSFETGPSRPVRTKAAWLSANRPIARRNLLAI